MAPHATSARNFLLLGVAATCGILGLHSVARMRLLAEENVQLRADLATAAAQRDSSEKMLEAKGDIPMEQTLKLQAAQEAACPPPPPIPPPPPPCPAIEGGGGSAPSPAPVAAPAAGGKDWRVPPGPIPPKPEKMPKWFKFQQPEQWCVPGPHNKVHSNRVAAIIVNYNMVERADNIAEGIKKHVKWPVDVIVVDNGSDLKDSPPSIHTAIRLEANVQTANGWLMGVEYAKALSHAYGYCYMAYWVWITTSEYIETKDILTPMAEVRFYAKHHGFYTENHGFYTENHGFYTDNHAFYTDNHAFYTDNHGFYRR